MTTRPKLQAEHALELIQSVQWAITPAGLEQIVAVASRETPTLEALEAALGRPLDNAHDVTVRDGVATIPATGPMFRYANLFTAISGATSYEVLAQDFTQALVNPAIRAILLAIDSPGGEVNGTSELAQMIYDARGQKPIVAYISHLGGSAAYWLASAADEVVVNDTAVVGSIGVVMTARGKSADGRIEFVSSQSPAKRVDPTSETGRSQIQALVDALGERFVETVARNRGVSPETVLADFGQGDVFVGAAAVEAGLADDVGTYESVLADLIEGTSPRAGGGVRLPARASTGRVAASTQEFQMADSKKSEPATLTAEQLVAQYPEQIAAIRAAAHAEGETAGKEAGRTEGATAERTRILAIEELGIAGAEQLIAGAKKDPAATPEATAMKVLAHQRANPAAAAAAADPGKKHLANMAGDEAKANAPSAQQPKSEAGVQETVATLVAFSSLRRAKAAAN